MPNISYDQTPNQSFVAKPKKRLTLPHFSFGKIGQLIGMAITLFITWLISSFFSGFFATVGNNATVVGLDIIFDPQITVAYIATYYFLSHFYNLSRNQMYYYFLLSLLLSFSVGFIEGSLMLVMLPPILKKLKLISTESKV